MKDLREIFEPESEAFTLSLSPLGVPSFLPPLIDDKKDFHADPARILRKCVSEKATPNMKIMEDF
jgi:hypothetical protein